MGIIFLCLYLLAALSKQHLLTNQKQTMDIKILMMCLVAFMAFGLSNAKRDPTQGETMACIQPCENEKRMVEAGTMKLEKTQIYQWFMDEEDFESCADYCMNFAMNNNSCGIQS